MKKYTERKKSVASIMHGTYDTLMTDLNIKTCTARNLKTENVTKTSNFTKLKRCGDWYYC